MTVSASRRRPELGEGCYISDRPERDDRSAARVLVGDFYRIDLAPFAQDLFCRFRFEFVPLLKGVSSYQQRTKFRVGLSLAENISDLIEVARQKFACKLQRQRFAEAELSFVRDCEVFLIIFDVIGQFIIQFIEVGKFGVQINLAGPPAQDGQLFAEAGENRRTQTR